MNIQEQIVTSIYVEKLLSPLTTEQRQAMILHSEGRTYQEVAAEMGVPYWRVKRLIAQALSKIRGFFGIRVAARSTNEGDEWWTLVLESLRRHAETLHFGTDDRRLVFSQPADLGGNSPEDHGSGLLNGF